MQTDEANICKCLRSYFCPDDIRFENAKIDVAGYIGVHLVYSQNGVGDAGTYNMPVYGYSKKGIERRTKVYNEVLVSSSITYSISKTK